MQAKLCNFINMFGSDFEVREGEIVTLNRIVIPIIQRDYAQGRKTKEIDRVRQRFLTALREAVTAEPVTLDFVYGDIDENGTLTPLDGQQRLTTLFLLHWYAAKKEGIASEEYDFLKRFSYETRPSATDFCEKLAEYNPTFKQTLSEEIEDRYWFPLEWKHDPTIRSMLVMLDAIDAVFGDISDIWSSLKNDAVTFYFLPIKDMGLTDELYIKMNSRGKPLTEFEHFKAELENKLKKVDPAKADDVIQKIDDVWTNLLWQYHTDNDHTVGNKFLNYFRFICSVICYKNGDTMQRKSTDAFDLIDDYFSEDCDNAEDNILTLESCFDCLCSIAGYGSPKEFFEEHIAYSHETGKITVDSHNYTLDPFGECLAGSFPLAHFLLLYAFVFYLQNTNLVTQEEFTRRIRIVNNLIRNSRDEISDNESRDGGNRIPREMEQIETIILSGTVDLKLGANFNRHQLEEEAHKITWLQTNAGSADALFRLEDHKLLYGQISVIGTDNMDCADAFESLFGCSYDLINCALMATGFYGQRENWWRWIFASSTKDSVWQSLFHKSSSACFDKTKSTLVKLLRTRDSFSDKDLIEIKDDFLETCEQNQDFCVRYYFVKYPLFRPDSYGKYRWVNLNNSYEVYVLQSKKYVSTNTYNPFLKTADSAHLATKQAYGDTLAYEDFEVTMNNSSFAVHYADGTEETIDISQNAEGIDTENRIVKLIDFLKQKGKLQ